MKVAPGLDDTFIWIEGPLFVFSLDFLSGLYGVSTKITFWYTESLP